MQLAMLGLGRMGMNMARRLARDGHQLCVWNRTAERAQELAARESSVSACGSLTELVASLTPPRQLWLMVPAGAAVDTLIEQLVPLLAPGDLLIDGGNSYYKDACRRADQLEARGLLFCDVGVSGGIWGLSEGYCLMVGGCRSAFDRIDPLLVSLAPPQGYLYCGAAGAGHFVKMLHNGIEYGMMQAYAEGFAVLEASEYGDQLDFAAVAHLWNQGSVVRSWLLELLEHAFTDDSRLQQLSGYVADSGEGRWTVQQAVETGVAAPVIALSLFQRFASRQPDAFSNRVLAALRREFGGHAVKSSAESQASP